MTEEQIQPQSAVDSQPKFQKTRKQKVRKDPNAPFIREKLELPCLLYTSDAADE